MRPTDHRSARPRSAAHAHDVHCSSPPAPTPMTRGSVRLVAARSARELARRLADWPEAGGASE
jgi:hypothetical protein